MTDTLSNSITILPKPKAHFSISDSTGCIPLGVNFSVQPSATAHYTWNFGDGGISHIAAPSHTYTSADTFPVRLIIIDSSSCNIADTALGRVITIDSSANADFVFSRIFYGCDSVFVNLWSTYVGEQSELWDFGDGTQIMDTDSVTHIFYNAGTFTITHVITDTNVVCRSLDTTRIVISLQPLHISVTIPDIGGCLPFLANFSGNSALLSTNFFWDFGDGNSGV